MMHKFSCAYNAVCMHIMCNLWRPAYHIKVKSGGVYVLRFHTSVCFPFWSKTYIKHWANNYLLSQNKTIFSMLVLIDHMLSILNKFQKNISCFQLWWRTYKNCCTNTYVISHVKILSLPAFGCYLFSISEYDVENNRMLCQQKYWNKR